MNLIDMHVVEVLKVYSAYGRWFVLVNANGWGAVSENLIMCSSEEEALKIGPGFVFQG